MIYTTNAALDKAPEALHGVGVDIAHHVDFGRMVDAPVLVTEWFAVLLQLLQRVVRLVLVSVDRAVRQDVFRSQPEQLLTASFDCSLGNHLTFALHHSDDPGFVLQPWAFALMKASSEVSFIHLRWPFKLKFLAEQRTNLFEHAPCGFVGDGGFALNLLCGNSAAGRTH